MTKHFPFVELVNMRETSVAMSAASRGPIETAFKRAIMCLFFTLTVTNVAVDVS
jgi:hypothetical protein